MPALVKQPVDVRLGVGLDQKTDDKQVQLGRFLALVNAVYDKGGRLTKRNGYPDLTVLPSNAGTLTITSYKNSLVSLGTTVQSYSTATELWTNAGALSPLTLNTLQVARPNAAVTQADCAVAMNLTNTQAGLACMVFTTAAGYFYQIVDATSGSTVVPATAIPTSATINGVPKVFLLGRYFVIVFSATNAGTERLQYVAVATANPSSVTTAADLTTQYTNASTTSWDGVVATNNDTLYLAWQGNDGSVRATMLTSTLSHGPTSVFAGEQGTVFGVTADVSSTLPTVYLTYWKSAGTLGRVAAVAANMSVVLAPTTFSSSGAIGNLAPYATSGSVTILYELEATAGYDATLPDNLVKSVTVTSGGSVGATTVLVRGVGLGSKSFALYGSFACLVLYSGTYENGYFMVDGRTGRVLCKLAYGNAPFAAGVNQGYLLTGVPNATYTLGTLYVAYRQADLVQAVNKTQGQSTTGVYLQTGGSIAEFTPEAIPAAAEIGETLLIVAGLVSIYDGSTVTEQGFNLWPDQVEATTTGTGGHLKAQQYFYQADYEYTDAQGILHRSAPSVPVGQVTVAGTPVTFTASFSSGASTITVSSTAGLSVGQVITDTTDPTTLTPGTFITSISGLTVGISNPALSTAGNHNMQTVDTSVNVVYVPTLRLTQKVGVRIVLYRWSTAQQVYYQTMVINNDPTVDYVTFTDTNNDHQIVGNTILYTTGGVLENIGAPPSNIMTLYRSRVCLVDAEDQNLAWYSKTVVEATPVEMNDGLTVFLAPTIGAQGSTGPITSMSSMDDKWVFLKKDALYYETGQGPDITGANNDFQDPVYVSSSVGCDNPQSIVLTPAGLIFQSDKGRWLLGRDLSTRYVGAPVDDLNSLTDTSAVAIPGTNQIRISTDGGPTLMYDYYYDQWGTFDTNLTSACVVDGAHTTLDKFGRVRQEVPGTYLDGSSPVLMSFTTGWGSLAGLQGYERAYFLYFLGQYFSPFFLNVSVAYDYSPTIRQQTTLVPQPDNSTFGSDPVFGASNAFGGTNNGVFAPRVILQKQRCQAFQVTVQEVYDASQGIPAGQGLNLSGMTAVVGVKRGTRTQSAAKSFG